MKLRCPYCRKTFEKAKRSRCPHCGKHVRIPGKLKDEGPDGSRRRKKNSRRPGITTTPARVMGGDRSSLTVIGILALFILIGGLLIRETNQDPGKPREDWRPGHAQDEINVLAKALELYREDCGHYPPLEDGLLALVKDPGTWGWEGPYVTLMRPDPWGNLYRYSVTNRTATLLCMGIDGRAGTGDDIVPEPAPEETPPNPE